MAFFLSSTAVPGDVRAVPDLSAVGGRDVLVVLHGYYGSALREKGGGTRHWLRLRTILAGAFRVSLNAEELEILPNPELEVEGTLSRFTVLPGIFSNDVYGRFLHRMERPDRQVLALAYDWRQDLFQAVEELDRLVTALKGAGAGRISLAAHSMGGLVAAYYLAYGAHAPERAELNWAGAGSVESAAFFGTPFGGVMSILRNMQHGTGYFWNPRLLQAGTVASFPSSYHLLPLEASYFLSPDGKRIPAELGEPSFWEEHRLGLLRDSPASALERRKAYTRAQLRRAALFQQKVRAAGQPPASLRLLNVVGMGRPTLESGYFASGELLFLAGDVKRKGLPFDLLHSDGDGSVPASSARLPPGLLPHARELTSTYAHDRLFLDPAVEKNYAEFLASTGGKR